MAEAQLGIQTVMFGEVIPGTDELAPEDCVALRYYQDGECGQTVLIPARAAMTVATEIAAAAGRLANNAVDDNGNKLSLVARIARLNRPES